MANSRWYQVILALSLTFHICKMRKTLTVSAKGVESFVLLPLWGGLRTMTNYDAVTKNKLDDGGRDRTAYFHFLHLEV